ncbi:SPT3 Dosage dependent suppressor of Ty-induced promoter mutations-like protein [Lodderomyces elongisporus]|uniref:SPT3 Dosage dependent suppressor of Ty-induced promoter mutations-like protein n=1 Tax=Lodderomyces elongisporus TaxID=36914 RepID=UPI0029257F0D|nr:SPT3 Dosage dependent suppressor of Ty-induced promoter mutations-like protein [Lodderomyces elongisporus]WLF79606.1 SPT3 Dosage dependent suppressor of Ty-induced promoter mutations-like protein [Lodderomyces elongisporus]
MTFAIKEEPLSSPFMNIDDNHDIRNPLRNIPGNIGNEGVVGDDENRDILDEFLDQRVYDTPEADMQLPLHKFENCASKHHQHQHHQHQHHQHQHQHQRSQNEDEDENLLSSLYALTSNGNTTINNYPDHNQSQQQNMDTSLDDAINDFDNQFQDIFTTQRDSSLNSEGVSPGDADYVYRDIPRDSNVSQLGANLNEQQSQQSQHGQTQFPTPINNPAFANSLGNSSHMVSALPPTSIPLTVYESIREELAKLKFGSHRINAVPKSISVPDPSYLDFSPEAMDKLPYKLTLDGLPCYSRVETQIKCKITLSPSPSESHLLHISQDLISKNKFCLATPVQSLDPLLKENLLYLDAYVLSSDLRKSCHICSRCIKREQKRASRGKAASTKSNSTNANKTADSGGDTEGANLDNQTDSKTPIKNNSSAWSDESMIKKAIIFNCKEIVSFPPPSGIPNEAFKSLELSARIICYCRHHKEQAGFKILVVIKNNKGDVVAKQISSPIMIMDRKKNIPLTRDSIPNSVASSSVNLKELGRGPENGLGQLSGSINGTGNDSVNGDGEATYKKKKLSASESDHDIKFDVSGDPHQLTPNSIDESNSDFHTNTDLESTNGLGMGLGNGNGHGTGIGNSNGTGNSHVRGLKRKKLSVDDPFNHPSNPMYNGSVNGHSPMSNSDTNTSANFNFLKQQPSSMSFQGMSPMALGSHCPPAPHLIQPNFQQSMSLPQQQQQQSPSQSQHLSQQQQMEQLRLPSIQRIIPAHGPVRGGIEITLLGFNFRPGLSVKFGAHRALATHCWSETTIVTYLPPAQQPGQVLVTFESDEIPILQPQQQSQIFTYTDDTDRQLIELALQIVGLKMNGKLEDAKNIARRIVGTDTKSGNGSTSTTPVESSNTPPTNTSGNANVHAYAWFDAAHRSLKKLTTSGLSTQIILVKLLSLVDMPNCPIVIPNWQLANKEGQTLLHLATMKNYAKLIKFLVTHGCKIDVKDNHGITPLFLASMNGNRSLMEFYIGYCKSNWNLKLSNNLYLKDYCDLNVIDMFSTLERETGSAREITDEEEIDEQGVVRRTMSFDSIDSVLEHNYGRHISTMVSYDEVTTPTLPSQAPSPSPTTHQQQQEQIGTSSPPNIPADDSNGKNYMDDRNYISDFADSEFDSEDDFDEDDADYCDDEYSENDDNNDDDDDDDDYGDDVNERKGENYDRGENIATAGSMIALAHGSMTPASIASVSSVATSSASTIRQVEENQVDNSVSNVATSAPSSPGIWQKVKNVFYKEEDSDSLPNYVDLYPSGPSSSSGAKPKSAIEQTLNQSQSITASQVTQVKDDLQESQRSSALPIVQESTLVEQDHDLDAGAASDSSEDMVISYINHPRKSVEHDKMLVFFWIPMLVMIVALFFMVNVMGYRIKQIDQIQSTMRDVLGNIMLGGNERIGRVFATKAAAVAASATGVLTGRG